MVESDIGKYPLAAERDVENESGKAICDDTAA
jgi:hypothetical protein